MAKKDPNKENSWKKYKTMILGIVLPLIVVAVYNYVHDIIQAGKDQLHKKSVVNIVITDADIENHYDTIFEINFAKKLKDPNIWAQVLGSGFVAKLITLEKEEVYTTVKAQIMEGDSINNNFIEEMGKAAGIRNENVTKAFGEMLKAFVDGNITRVRYVGADF
jgi:hypothetical protein